jgi:hypothetical protein
MNLFHAIRQCSITAILVVASPSIYLCPAFAGKVPNGRYGSESGTDGIIEVRGNQHRISNLDGTSPWKSNSNLVVVKKGVIQYKTDRRYYYCLVNLIPDTGKLYKCTKNGWKLISRHTR